MNNRLENILKQKLLKRDSLFYTGITEIKQYKPISVNCAALSKEGETFSKSIGHCLKTLMICINKEWSIQKTISVFLSSFSINLLVVYRGFVNLIGYITVDKLVVYHQCCILIVELWQQKRNELALTCEKLFSLDIFEKLIEIYRNNYSPRPHSL